MKERKEGKGKGGREGGEEGLVVNEAYCTLKINKSVQREA